MTNEHLQKAAFLADGNRLRIFALINNGGKSVFAIIKKACLSKPLGSHHLKELKRRLKVRVEREGPFIGYALAESNYGGT